MRPNPPRRLLRGLIAVVAVGLALAPATASAASIGGFAVRPATFDRAVPATRAYFIVHAGRGNSPREVSVITNDGGTPLTLDVDPVDGLTGVT
jgi:hypothetical protein